MSWTQHTKKLTTTTTTTTTTTKTMSKQTMKSFAWRHFLHSDGELLKIMPTELKTPWLCHIALKTSYKPLGTEGEKYVPEHLRDAVDRISNWQDADILDEDEEYSNNEYYWNSPYERPFNEAGEIDVSNACIVCGGKPDGTISTNYFAINGLDCCDTCYEEHIRFGNMCNTQITGLVKPKTKISFKTKNSCTITPA